MDATVASSVEIHRDEVADRKRAGRRCARKWRFEFGELEIEFRLPHRSLLRRNGGFRHALRLGPLVEVCCVIVVPRTSSSPRLRSASAKDEVGLCLRERSLCPIERGLERPPVDGKQRIARLYELAVFELDLVQIAGDAGSNLDEIEGHEATNIFVIVTDQLFNRLGDGHLRRRRSCTRLPAGFSPPQAAQRERER